MATIGTRLYTLLKGRFVGADQFGNRYYTERGGRKGQRAKRWVVYQGMAEPSKVPPLWRGWLHYTTDVLPTEANAPHYSWMKEHQPNLTGTAGAYVPRGHVRRGAQRDAATSDYEAWKPGDAA